MILTTHTSLTRWEKNESKGEPQACASDQKESLPGKNTAPKLQSDLHVGLERNFRLKEQTGYSCPGLRLLPSPGPQTSVWVHV